MTDLEYEGFVQMRQDHNLPVWSREVCENLEPPWAAGTRFRFREYALTGEWISENEG